MQNLIDMSNHILKHPAYYAGKQEATEEIIAEAIDLTFKYGDFAVQFVANGRGYFKFKKIFNGP